MVNTKIRKSYWSRKPWYRHLRWARERCNRPKHISYPYYGGRGIKCLLSLSEAEALWSVCDAKKLVKPSLDRLNSDGDYTFENCRFIETRENVSAVMFRSKKDVAQEA